MKIRLFREKDRPILQEIYLLSRAQSFVWQKVESFEFSDFDKDTHGEKIWVATIREVPVGFASIWIQDSFLHNLFIHPDFMRKGIGKRLLAKSIASLKKPISLKCIKQNKSALDFYNANGWAIVSEGIGENNIEYVLMVFN